MRFRKKPVEVEAVLCADLINAFAHDWSTLPDWAAEAYEQGVIVAVREQDLTIKTLEGDHLARRGDWIIRGVKGELYPCKPDIFEQTYERVPERVEA
jgi:hypothetical protein